MANAQAKVQDQCTWLLETLEQARRDVERLTAEVVELRAFKDNIMGMWGSIFASMGNAGMFYGSGLTDGGLPPTENKGTLIRPVPIVQLNPGFGFIPQDTTLDSSSITVLDGTYKAESPPPTNTAANTNPSAVTDPPSPPTTSSQPPTTSGLIMPSQPLPPVQRDELHPPPPPPPQNYFLVLRRNPQ